MSLVLLGTPASDTITFTIGGHPARQLAQVESVADFETFTGKTNKVTGSMSFDPKTFKGSGKIEVDMASLNTGIERRDEHMRGERWMHTDKYPTATFETTKVERIKGDDYRVNGKFTLRGVTKAIMATAKVRYRPESDATKKAGFKGDVLHVATSFKIKLSDYGIKDTAVEAGKVNDEVTITFTAFATVPQPAQ